MKSIQDQIKALIPELHTLDSKPTCSECGGKGYIQCDKEESEISDTKTTFNDKDEISNEVIYLKRCRCRIESDFKYRMRMSGLSGVEELSFTNYITKYNWQKDYLIRAKSFRNDDKQLFFMSGPSGSGKTRLSSTLFKYLVYEGNSGIYMQWENEVLKVKNNYSKMDLDDYYEFINIPILYIDDFLKCPGNDISKLSDAELIIARTIVNARYERKNKKTIISTELTDKDLKSIDKSLFGRLQEMATDKYLIVMNPNENRDIREEIFKKTW